MQVSSRISIWHPVSLNATIWFPRYWLQNSTLIFVCDFLFFILPVVRANRGNRLSEHYSKQQCCETIPLTVNIDTGMWLQYIRVHMCTYIIYIVINHRWFLLQVNYNVNSIFIPQKYCLQQVVFHSSCVIYPIWLQTVHIHSNIHAEPKILLNCTVMILRNYLNWTLWAA